MKVILLGTAGYHPNERRHTSCVLLPDLRVMLDAGTALFRAGKYLQGDSLDIFLTHSHLDHVVGLTYLFDLVREHPLERIHVHAAPEKCRAIAEHLLAPLLFPARLPFELRPLLRPTELAGGGCCRFFELEHPGGVLGFRLDCAGRSLAYVTDTTADPSASYVEHIGGVDLLIHECYADDAQQDFARQTGHSWPSAVAQTAAAAGVGRLVLTHLNPLLDDSTPAWLDAARRFFPNLIAAEDGMEIEWE